MERCFQEEEALKRTGTATAAHLNRYRRITQPAFIVLIFLIPVLDIFRFDSATRELRGRGLFHYSLGEGKCPAPRENCAHAPVKGRAEA
jgi:hypothetical protein